MKMILAMTLIMTSFSSFAQTPATKAAAPAPAAAPGAPAPGQKPTFEQQKEGVIKFLTERMTELQKGIACVNASKVQADLDACRAKMEKMREEAEKKRKEARERFNNN